MTMIIRDVMLGNEKLDAMGFKEEALGRNGLFGGFQGQRMWTDYQPNGDFTEAILKFLVRLARKTSADGICDRK